MKTIIFLLLCLTSLSFGQQHVYSVSPVINSTEIDSIVVTVNSATVHSVTKPFSGVTAGSQIQSLRFPLGTTVVSNTNDSILVLSNPATATVALDSARFAVNTNLQYSAGDALGFPFEIKGGLTKIDNVIVVDAAKQITAVKLLFFRDKFTETEDNSPFAISDADATNLIGYLSLATSEVFANNQIVTGASTTLPIFLHPGKLYCQLICVGTPTFAAVNNLKVNIIGE